MTRRTMRGRSAVPAILDEAMIGALAQAIRPVELTATERSRLKERVLAAARRTERTTTDAASVQDVPRAQDAAPPGTFTLRAEQGEWQRVSDLVQVKVLRRNAARNDQTVLIRMLAGSEIVAHPHSQEEECLVLEGEIEIGGHRLRQGDMHVAAAGTHHARIRSRSGALLLVRSEIPPEGFSIV